MAIRVNHMPGTGGDMFKMCISILIEGSSSIYYNDDPGAWITESGYVPWDIHVHSNLLKTHEITRGEYLPGDTIIIPKNLDTYLWVRATMVYKINSFTRVYDTGERELECKRFTWVCDNAIDHMDKLSKTNILNTCNIVYVEELLRKASFIEAINRTIKYYNITLVGSMSDTIEFWQEWRNSQYIDYE